MTKIKKIDPKSAQSIFSFACPCLGSCYCSCQCNSIESVQVASHNSTNNSTYRSVPGSQTVNYN